MKTLGDYNAITPLERVKDRIAKKEGFDTWRDLTFKVNGLSLELIMDKVAEEYASTKSSNQSVGEQINDWEEVENELFTALGQVSMCWTPEPSSQVFDSSKEKEIGDKFMNYLKLIFLSSYHF